MNLIKKVSSSVHRWMLIGSGALIVLGLAFTIPNGTTLAVAVVGPSPTPTPAQVPSSPTLKPPSNQTPRTPGSGAADLSQAFKHEQQVLATQQNNLNNATGSVSKIQDLIDQAAAKGIDTSALSSALATFQGQLATANAWHTTAAGLIASANGFDANGNVIALAAARDTIQEARQGLVDCHTTLQQAVSDLHSAVKSWEASTKDPFQIQHLQVDYQNEQGWLTTQQGNLAKTQEAVSRVQDLIGRAQAKGLDTSALEGALSSFQAEIATATGFDTSAAGILSTHAGFDGSWTVTDQGSAQQTVKDANQALADAHTSLVQAVSDLQAAIQQWLAKYAPNFTPSVSTNNG